MAEGYVQLKDGDWIPASSIVRVSEIPSYGCEVLTIGGETYTLRVRATEFIQRTGGHLVGDFAS